MRSTKSAPARDLADVQRREPGERFIFPPLTVVRSSYREVSYGGITSTVYDYVFGDSKGLWSVEYSGRYHHAWHGGATVLLMATVKSQRPRWRVTKIVRPLILQPGDMPLFGGD